jgi:hypothetical protein
MGKLSPSRKRNNTRLKQLLDITTFVKPRMENRANKVGLREEHSSWEFGLRGALYLRQPFTNQSSFRVFRKQSFVQGLQKLVLCSIIIPSTLLELGLDALRQNLFSTKTEQPGKTRKPTVGQVSGPNLWCKYWRTVRPHSICFSTIIFTITRGWHNRPGVAAVPIASQPK